MQKSLTDNKELKYVIINNTLPNSELFMRKKLRSAEKKRSNQVVLTWFKKEK